MFESRTKDNREMRDKVSGSRVHCGKGHRKWGVLWVCHEIGKGNQKHKIEVE